MRKILLVLLLVSSVTAFAAPRKGDWVGSMGMGIIFDGSLFLLSPQFEYIQSRRVRYGALIQLGLSSGTVATFSGSARYTFPTSRRKIHPFIEGAIGLTIASGFTDSIGAHLMAALGLDYDITTDFAVGTSFRFNFAPPIDNFFISWPIAVGRLRF